MNRLCGALVVAWIAVGCGGSSEQTPPLGEGGDSGGGMDSGGETSAQVCDPRAAPVCEGASAVKQCRADGSGFDTVACDVGAPCKGGVCGCAPKSAICEGTSVKTCNDAGEYVAAFMCPKGTQCIKGHCDDLRCPDETAVPKEFALPSNAWPRYRHDNRNSGWTRAIVADAPKLKWKIFIGGTDYDMQKGLGSGAVVNQENRIFIGAGELDGKGGQFYAFDPAGKPVYAFASNRLTGLSTPAVRNDGTAYVASGAALFFAVTPLGTKQWSYMPGAASDGDPIVTREGTLVYPSDDKSIYALDPSGTLLWKSDVVGGPGEVDAALAQSCDGRILAGGTNGWSSLDLKTGKAQWLVPATGTYQCTSSSPVLSADGTMFGIDSGGNGYAIDPSGKILWSKSVGPGGASTPAHVGDTLYVVLNDGKLHAIDDATGAEKWARPIGYALTRDVGRISGPVIDGNMRLYINSTDGNVYAFDITGKMLWKLAASGVNAPQLFSGTIAIGFDGTMYVPGNDGFLYAFQ